MMEFMQTDHNAEKVHECLYCSQKYPSERDLSIHEYIHGSYMREAIFNLTIRPRNSYLIYEDFNFVCGRMKSGLMFKELGSAETPEQERIESPNKKEFDKSSLRNLPRDHLTPQEYDDKYFNKIPIEKSSSNNLSFYHLTPPQSDGKLPKKKPFYESSSSLPNSQQLTPPQLDKKESDTTSSNIIFCHNLTLMPHYQEQASYSSNSHRDLFAYKTFEGVFSKESEEDDEIFRALTEDLLVKYGTFPRRNNAKARENWADRYKTSLKSETNGRGDPPIEFSPGIRF